MTLNPSEPTSAGYGQPVTVTVTIPYGSVSWFPSMFIGFLNVARSCSFEFLISGAIFAKVLEDPFPGERSGGQSAQGEAAHQHARFHANQPGGKSVGIVVTSSITHATPAAFLAHAVSRKSEYEIAEQIAHSRTDILIGGGRRFFLPERSGGGRTDDRDLLAEMRAAGYAAPTDLPDTAVGRGPCIVLLADEGLPSAMKREITLARMVRSALAILRRNPNGFFLMIEGSQIDWAAHDNDFDALLAEMADFDGAIGDRTRRSDNVRPRSQTQIPAQRPIRKRKNVDILTYVSRHDFFTISQNTRLDVVSTQDGRTGCEQTRNCGVPLYSKAWGC